MKKLLLSILFLPIIAVAQTAPTIGPKCWPDVTLPLNLVLLQKQTNPTIPIGSIVYSASTIGLVWGYTCKASDGTHWKQIAAGPWEAFPKDWLYIADTLLRGTDADKAAAWQKYVTATEWDARLTPDLDAVWAKLPVPPPPPPAPVPSSFVVAPTTVCITADKVNGICTKRGTYIWTGTARGALATEKVDIGSFCNPAIGAVGYYGVLGRTDRVAPCVKK